MENFYIVELIVFCLIALITAYLIALFIKSEAFKTYSCFNIMLMSIILFLNCLLLPLSENNIINEKNYVGRFIVNLICTFLNKMLLTVLSLQVIIVYSGIIHTNFYFSHEKSFVKIGDTVCAIVSAALAVVYSSIRWVRRVDKDNIKKMVFDDNEYNDNLQDEKIRQRVLAKNIIETIFCGINFFVNVFFLIIVILHISRKRREARAGLIQDLGYGYQLLRFSLIFSVNIIAIIFSGVVVNFNVVLGISQNNYKYCEIIFLIICFLIELCFMINKTVYQETLKIFCKKKYREIQDDEKLKSVSTFNIDVEEDRFKSVSTFDIDVGEDDDDDNN